MAKMKALADEMAAVGKPLGTEELMSYILASLDMEYNPLVTLMLARKDLIPYNELLSQMLSFESRLDLLQQGSSGSQSSINSASRGGGRTSGNRGSVRGHGQSGGGRGRGFGSGGRGRGASNFGGQKPRYNGQCQVCFKEGHSAATCWHRFDADYVPDQKNVNSAVNRYGADNSWYTDTGATDHITSELDKLVIHDKYNDGDRIRTASGAGMNINHIGKVVVSTPNGNLKLNNVLHVPSAKKNLVSIHRLATDNHAFLEFHPDFFLIKDQAMRRTLLEGKCRGGLYPLPESRREAHSAVNSSTARWHSRLGHPAFPLLIESLVRINYLVLGKLVRIQFVMPVNKPKDTNYPIPSHLMFLNFL
jgi:hypothetical protein